MTKQQAQTQWSDNRKDIASIAGVEEIEVENIYNAIVDHCIQVLRRDNEVYLPRLVELKRNEGQVKATSKIEFNEKEQTVI